MVSDKFDIIAETSPLMTFSDYEDGVTEHFTIHGPHLGQSQATWSTRFHYDNSFWDEQMDLTRDPQHGVWVMGPIQKRKWARHGRRPKLVWGPSSRVWEATRRVFSGVRRGSRTNRPWYWNGDEWWCQNVRPSVILGELGMMFSLRDETTRRRSLATMCSLPCPTWFRYSKLLKTNVEEKRLLIRVFGLTM